MFVLLFYTDAERQHRSGVSHEIHRGAPKAETHKEPFYLLNSPIGELVV